MTTGSERGGSDVVLGPAQYGKAEVRLLHVDRGGPRHDITDLNVSIILAGDFAETYLTGDNARVLTTDAQKNTVYALARKFGVTPVEEFDPYTTLEPTQDRILATAVRGHWRYADTEQAWDAAFTGARAALAEAFAAVYSRSLQQTLYAMGEAVLVAVPGACEARFSLPNKHHFLVDLAPFGLDNPGEVFYAADRPYGLIEGTVGRAGAAPGDQGHQW